MNIRVKLPSPVVPRPSDAVIVVDELVTEGYCDLPLWMIRPSRTNRTYFNVDALQQLADNIAEVGILQPILVRPVAPSDEYPQHYEIVAGERRFRAAVIAGLAVVSVRVRAMTDLQAAELQLIENLQREDPHPLEEAEGMQLLMQNHGYNADQLAAAVKQSRSYVYGRLKLCDLAKSVREEFMGEQFNASIGLLIARLPTPALQDKAAKEIKAGNGWAGEPMSFRTARDHIRRNYMLDLSKALFPIKDASLLAAAGNCNNCPKRAGNQPELYPDPKDADTCTEPSCYHEKTAAFQQRQRDDAAEKGLPVIAGDAAMKLMPNSYSKLRGGYSDIDAQMWVGGTHTSYRKILGKGLPQVSLLENPHRPGVFLQIARTDELEDLVESKAGKGKTEASQAAAAQVKEKNQEREAAIERQYRKDLFAAVRVGQADVPHYDERDVAEILFRTCYDNADTFISKFWGWHGSEYESTSTEGRYVHRSDKIATAIRSFDPAQARQLIRDLVLARDLPVNTYTSSGEKPARLMAAAQALNVDAKAMRDELAMAAKAKEQEKAAKAKKKSAKLKPLAQAEIELPPSPDQAAESASPAAGEFHAAPQGEDIRPLTMDDLTNVELGAFIAANSARIEELTELVIDQAPHMLKTLERAAERVGFTYRGGWRKAAETPGEDRIAVLAAAGYVVRATTADPSCTPSEPVRETLKLKSKEVVPPPAPAGPIIKVKKRPRSVALSQDDWPASTPSSDTDQTSQQDPV